MKHLFLTVLLSVLVNLSFAQTNHMKFKGIPMEGTLNSFVQKLKDTDDENLISDISEVLLDQALLIAGVELKEPAEFVKHLNSLLSK